jgi:hypothetical protein
MWKILWSAHRPIKVSDGYDYIPVTANLWDVQNSHMTNASTQDKLGHDLLHNEQVPPQYMDFNKYATTAGLSQILHNRVLRTIGILPRMKEPRRQL